VALDAGGLDRLEADLRAGRFPETVGFFFGHSDGTEIEDDLTFIAKARQHLADGLTVYYTSWW
jgi:lysophospholipase L1-like esterase